MPKENGTGNGKYADEEYFLVPRDESGDVLPIDHKLENGNMVEIIPLTEGKIQKYFGDFGKASELTDSDVAELLDKHVGKPLEDKNIDEDFLHDYFWPMKSAELLNAILVESGAIVDNVEVDDDGSATVETSDPDSEGEEKKGQTSATKAS